ncbi:MAG TPA: xanthine dehydrogenase family protein molybdopterin-binding subunit [Acidimicrobiales bacterium]|nr:xanthine dehydrogenase family protein molybdopterin-binding subunit [Acidimicrobiales bacterium]
MIPLVELVPDVEPPTEVMGIGTSAPRLEDRPLVQGRGCFVGDFKRPGMLHAAIIRSPYAHARITGIEVSAAMALEGVHDVVVGADLPSDTLIPMRQFRVPGAELFLQSPMARDVVRYSGEPVAVVIADSRYIAEDAAELVEIDFEELPVVLDAEVALAADAPRLHQGTPSNVAGDMVIGHGDVDQAFASADLVLEEVLRIQRHAAVPLETRGLVAEFDEAEGSLTVWGAAKIPHVNKGILARLLGWEERRIRLVELHVGGGFGARGEFYPEDYLIPFCAMRCKRPIAWIEDRDENLRAMNHSREQIHHVSVAVRADGKFLGLKDELICDTGGYIRTHGMTVPAMAAAMMPGPYEWPAYHCHVQSVVTNKTPAGTYRSPGRYEANFVRERLLDMVAHRLGIDPVELRRRNLLAEDVFPYDAGTTYDGHDVIFDSGKYELLLDKSIECFDVDAMRRWRDEPVQGPLRRGVGMAFFVEKAGPAVKEYARVEVGATGEVVVFSGTASVGQGVETVLAQVCASHLGIPYERISVKHGDTAVIPEGMGAFGSRAAMLGGAAVMLAARDVREHVLKLASDELEAAPEDLKLAAGGVVVRGSESKRVAWSRLVELNGGTFKEEGRYSCEFLGYPYGVHFAAVEVDTETGGIEIKKYAVGYDVGRCINPMLIRGQITGGAAQGIGGALYEEFAFDPNGQPLAASFMDYLLPTVQEVPKIDILVTEDAPCPLNPLGVKGAGEGGTAAVGAALANAVSDALGVEVTALPLSPERIAQLIGGNQ